ncbi:FAD-dependent oxidoreductase [Staphylococcus sp. IVB6238]|uniref:FAD-dependent oxidoreductase n=1 Tax=unclassified Staphylococcus TaxID=91994 RepID=UPI0021CFE7F8|nr:MULTISPECIES: FAD-dependent oxidoreductase [unclassified Staphylococcus]UXR74678.1 FAD-dependent oxidoreductase [Staphylococcus sp. IVB6238]UXR77619.1 FAD-dependent oxidoreductase [Staphylococcus sp. IVB6227]UXR83239.1 FAD-dependent oxidoreductase [Staphylococcus sp. IVB6214]
MKNFDYVILGFGQGGKMFAKEEAQSGKKIAVVEKNSLYGGTCINVGCIPSKVIAHDSQHEVDFKDSIERKNEVVAAPHSLIWVGLIIQVWVPKKSLKISEIWHVILNKIKKNPVFTGFLKLKCL